MDPSDRQAMLFEAELVDNPYTEEENMAFNSMPMRKIPSADDPEHL